MIEFLCPNGHHIRCGDQQAGRAAKCPRCGVAFRVPDAPTAPAESPVFQEDAGEGPAARPAQSEPAPGEVNQTKVDTSAMHRGTASKPAKIAFTPLDPTTTPDDAGLDLSRMPATGPSASSSEAANASNELPETSAADRSPEPSAKPELFEFLCPNGHQLNALRRSAGRAGQCPTCGIRMRIPDAETVEGPMWSDDPDSTPEEQTLSGMSREDSGDRDSATVPPPTGRQQVAEAAATSASMPSAQATAADAAPFDQPHPMADLLLTVWREKPEGKVVEVHLRDGTRLTVERLAERLDHPAFVLLAGKGDDGRFTLHAVAWDAIAGAFVDGLDELPEAFGT